MNLGQTLIIRSFVVFTLLGIGLTLQPNATPRPSLPADTSRSQALVQKAQALLRQKDVEGARSLLSQALRLDPENFDASLLLGRIHLDTNRPNEALKYFHKSLRLRPGDNAATFYLARTQLETGQLPEAFKLFGQLVDREPDVAANKAYLLRAALRLKKSGVALQMLLELRQKEPQNGPLHAQLAEWCFEDAPLDLALEQIRFTLNLEPPKSREARLRYFLADLHHRAGRDAEAVKELSLVLSLDDSREEYFATILNLQSAATVEAIDRRVLQKGLAKFPNSKSLLVLDALLKIQGNQTAQASQIIASLLAQDPEDSSLYVLRGGLELNRMEFDKAVQTFRHALTLRADNPAALYYLAISYRRLGRDAEALELFEKAVTLNAGYADAWLEYGRLLHDTGRHEKAAEALSHAIRLAPDRPAAYRLMAQVQLKLGNTGEASRFQNKFKELSQHTRAPN